MFKSRIVGIAAALSALLSVTSTAMAYDRQASEAQDTVQDTVQGIVHAPGRYAAEYGTRSERAFNGDAYASEGRTAYSGRQHDGDQTGAPQARSKRFDRNVAVVGTYASAQSAAYDGRRNDAVWGQPTTSMEQHAIDRLASGGQGGN